MNFQRKHSVIFVFVLLLIKIKCQNSIEYHIPRPTAVALYPSGFRISIPDKQGIALFAFHGSINKNLKGNDIGDFNGETRTRKRNEWSYETTQADLQPGDVLNFWIYVQYRNYGYRLDNQRFIYPNDFVASTITQITNENLDNSNDEGSTYEQNYNNGNPVWDAVNMQNQVTSSSLNTQHGQNFGIVNNHEIVYRQTTTRATQRPSSFETGDSNIYQNSNRQTTRSPSNSYGTSVRPAGHQTTRNTQQSTYLSNPNREPNIWATTRSPQNKDENHNDENHQGMSHGYSANEHQDSNYNTNQNQNQNQNHSQRPNRNCPPSMTTVNGKQVKCRGSPIFEEQFTAETVYSKWNPDIRMPLENEDAEFVLYQDYPSVWNVSNGNLHIYPKLLFHVPELGFSESDVRTGHYIINPNECTSLVDPIQECQRHAGAKRILPPIVTAKIRSKKSFNFKYGHVEIRAKLPKGDWLFPQILLEPTQNIYRGAGDLAFLNGQIRIAFARGNELLEKLDGIPLDGKFLTSQTIVSPGDTVRENSRKSIQIGQDHFGNDFHTYSIIWTNTSIKFIVDGQEYGTDTGGFKKVKTIPNAVYWESGTNMAPFDQEFHISLGVAAGGNADFPEDSVTGLQKIPKPWENTSPKAELNFFLSAQDWWPTWNSYDSGLIVDYVKVYSV